MKKTTIVLLLACVAVSAQQKGIFTDSRDGRKYKTVKIGEQTWMAENLNYNASGSKCYSNNQSNCDKYGRLYNWETAMAVCPKDWHLPSDAEWTTLTDFVGGSSTAGTKLKATSGWYANGSGTDDFGFSALPGGGYSGGSFLDVGSDGLWWSASEDALDSDVAYYRGMYYHYEYVDGNYYDKSFLFSVRCVQTLCETATPVPAKSAKTTCEMETNKAKVIADRCKKIGKGKNCYDECAEEYNTQRDKAQKACRPGERSFL